MQQAKVSSEVIPTTKEGIIFDHPRAPFNRESITNEILRQRQKFMLYLQVENESFRIPERMVNTGITNSWYIALDCFGVQQYPATILFASIAVEALLNHDSRLYNYRKSIRRKWIDLSLENLKVASDSGIDITPMLDRKKKGSSDTDKRGSEFVVRRNKIAHGDLSGYFGFLQEEKPNRELTEKILITRKQALNQLNRSFRFITKWAKSKPTIILDEQEVIR